MKARISGAIVTLVLLGAFVVACVQVQTDSEAIFGQDGAAPNALDGPDARQMIIVLEAAEPAARLAAARAVGMLLDADPSVAELRLGPAAPDPAFADWIWLHRFQIAPPGPAAFTPQAMAERLADARARLASAEGMVQGDRLLRDPTGSFAGILDRLMSLKSGLDARDGVWEARDASAAILFATLSARPFQADEMQALAGRIIATSAAEGAVAHLIGPRIIAAEISTHIARASTWTAVIALVLLLIWLRWSLGSLRLTGLVMLPLALGLAVAVLAVQGVFGGVHVIALGFGGALCGLALDYPLHLIGHPGASRRPAARLVLIGAITTAVGFLSLIGSGVVALTQTGMFVACGLLVSAAAARLVVPSEVDRMSLKPLPLPSWRLPGIRWVELGLFILGLLVALANGHAPPRPLFEPPAEVTARLDRVRQMIDLPSGRYFVTVEGRTFADLLAEESALRPVLDQAVASGVLDGYTMLARLITTAGVPENLPAPKAFAATATKALTIAGMRPDFAERQLTVYRDALFAPEITPQDLHGFAETRALGALLEPIDGAWRSRVRLTGLKDPEALREFLGAQDVALADAVAPIRQGLAEVYRNVVIWLCIGAVAAFACLAAGLLDVRLAGAIALTSLAALGLTVCAVTLIGGFPGILQVAAMTLVVGIGIDYGLFLRGGPAGGQSAARASVGLCAISTLIAFSVMALSPVKILHEIGLTVSLGVIAMLGLHLSHSPPGGTDGA